MSKEIKVQTSSGNVFADLGLANPEELLVKAALVRQIGELIALRQLTQTQAAELLGVDQPKVSALLRGKLAGFSIERLFRFLNALGSDVEIRVTTKPCSDSPARTKVVAVSDRVTNL
jgi:predicted XRE-type DNA-binding protein